MTFDHRYTTRKPWESDSPESLDMLKMDKQFHIDTETRRDTLDDYYVMHQHPVFGDIYLMKHDIFFWTQIGWHPAGVKIDD